MQYLEVSCAVRHFFKSLGFKGLKYINIEQASGKITYSSPPKKEERAFNQKSEMLNNDSMTGFIYVLLFLLYSHNSVAGFSLLDFEVS